MQAVHHIYWNGSSPGIVPLPVSNVGLRLFHHLPLPQEHLRLQLDFTSLSCVQEFEHSRKVCKILNIYSMHISERAFRLPELASLLGFKRIALQKKKSFNTATGEKRFWLFVHRKYFSNSNYVTRLQNIGQLGFLEYYTGKGETMVFSRPRCHL